MMSHCNHSVALQISWHYQTKQLLQKPRSLFTSVLLTKIIALNCCSVHDCILLYSRIFDFYHFSSTAVIQVICNCRVYSFCNKFYAILFNFLFVVDVLGYAKYFRNLIIYFNKTF